MATYILQRCFSGLEQKEFAYINEAGEWVNSLTLKKQGVNVTKDNVISTLNAGQANTQAINEGKMAEQQARKAAGHAQQETFNNLAKQGNKAEIAKMQTANAAKASQVGQTAALETARKQGMETGFKNGQNSVGAVQGFKNTWSNWGQQGFKGGMKKAGVIAGGTILAATAIKGLTSGSKQKKLEQENADLRRQMANSKAY